MKKIDLLNLKGEKVNELKLNEEIFSITPNDKVLYDAIILARASLRQGTHSTKTTHKDINNYGDLVARIESNYRAEKEKLRMSFESDSTRPSEVAKVADENINELSEVKSGSEIFVEVANIPEVASDAYVKENLDNYIAEYDEVINQARMLADDYRKLATVNASINYYKKIIS